VHADYGADASDSDPFDLFEGADCGGCDVWGSGGVFIGFEAELFDEEKHGGVALNASGGLACT